MELYDLIKERLKDFLPEVRSIVGGERVPLGQASATNVHGVYMLYDETDNVVYVGQAAGRAGLKDRFGKHISGDSSHAAQRALLAKIPEKPERNKYIREKIKVSWVEVADKKRISDLERLLIWLYQPEWNRA